MKLKIRGKTWRLLVRRPPVNGCEGYCVLTEKTIYIRPSSKCKLETVIHEILHACFWDLREEAVQEAEDAIIAGIAMLTKHEWITENSPK